MKIWAEHTYIINRKDRVDRKEHAINQLSKLGYSDGEYTVWEAAIPGDVKIRWKPDPSKEGWNKYAAALCVSTIKILEDAKEKGYENILICEDDVMFVKDALRKSFDMHQKIDPTTYDIFHFGHLSKPGNKVTKVKEGIVRLKGSLMCHCYVINSRIFDDMIETISRMDQPLDWVTSTLFHPKGRCYAAEPAIATQKPDYSNIRNKDVNYNIN